ncbi:hypothetical protein C7H19_04360 [Aphanothece hegewaldii CCALA 016]|uniref:Uncharacterized protein n=1 Tax=Aphanothece hegewaldii CCALA 016 TaxID=2107694 RepID=A0A2T1M208_9CHRO|nr:DUF167 domain-containing protein [Aphanothece hegewaldii]PSF38743.1 hypothetical protein C7H19_04360 [Aphanothece hegewaldii CCALA 016]
MKIQVKVKPNSKLQKIEETTYGSLVIYLKSPSVDEKANQELIQVLAQKYKVAKFKIMIKSGTTSKIKLVEIQIAG